MLANTDPLFVAALASVAVGAGPYRRMMPLRNRMTPLGEAIADPARGLVYGNRKTYECNSRPHIRGELYCDH